MVINGAMLQDFSLNYDAIENNKHKYMPDSVFETHMELPVALYRLCFCYIPFCAVTCHCWYLLNKKSSPTNRPMKMNITYVILTICCTAEILLTGAKIVLVAMDIYQNQKPMDNDIPLYILTILECLLILIGCLCQFGIIYLANSHAVNEPIQNVEGLFYYLAAFNFSQWALNSFMETGYLTHRIEMNRSVVPAWEAVVHLCMPLITYFRYICAFLILDAKTCIENDIEMLSRGADNLIHENSRFRYRVTGHGINRQEPIGASYEGMDERSALLCHMPN